MASRLVFVLVLLALPFLLDAQLAPFLAILKGSLKFSKLGKLMTSQFIQEIAEHLMSSSDGFTIFAPTNDAFDKLPEGAFKSLTMEEKTKLLLVHAVPKYFNFDMLHTAPSSVSTLASGFKLNFTSGNEQVNVTAGGVTSRVVSANYAKFPLAIFRIDAVLIPPSLADVFNKG